MSEMVVYLSDGWRAQARRMLERQLTPQNTGNVCLSMSTAYTNCPDGIDKYTFAKLVDGSLETFDIGKGDAPEADLCICADYSVFVQIASQQLSGQSALMSGKLKIKGNMMKVMQFAPLSDAIMKVLASIPTVYE